MREETVALMMLAMVRLVVLAVMMVTRRIWMGMVMMTIIMTLMTPQRQ